MNHHLRIATAAAAVLIATIVAGCGDGTDGRFDARVDQARTAIDAGDRAGALEALDGLALEGLAAHDDGAITDDELAELASLIDSVRSLVDEVVPEPVADSTTTTTTSSTATSSPPPPTTEPPDDERPGKGKPDEKGEKDDDDDDD